MDHRVPPAVTKAAEAAGIEPAALLALIVVESAGRPFWNVNGQEKPPIRFEGHYFHRLLSGEARQQAIREGLASPKAGEIKNPKSYAGRYEMLNRAIQLDRRAACASCSWGLGQVMGSHAEALGYGSPIELARAAETIEGQVDMVVRYLRVNNLIEPLNQHEWQTVAKGYNGPAYAKNRYDQKLASTYAELKAGGKAHVSSSDPTVRLVQQKLAQLGYEPGPVDGLYGPLTEAAVRTFQRDEGLIEDGDAGPLTLQALDAEIAERAKAQNAATKKTAENVGSGAAGGAAVGLIVAVIEIVRRMDPETTATFVERVAVALATLHPAVATGLVVSGVLALGALAVAKTLARRT